MQRKMGRCFRHFATMLLLSGFALLSTTQVNCASAASATDSSSTAKDTSLSVKTAAAPRPSKKWLRGAKSAAGKHQVTVDRFDRERGLLASYEAPNGERLLFRAAFITPNLPYAEILYFDEETGKVERLFPTSDSSRMTGRRHGQPSTRELASLLREVSKTGVQSDQAKAKLERIEKFGNSPLVRAAEDGVIALYLALESPNLDPALARMVKPLGAFAMATQLSAGNRSRRTPIGDLASPAALLPLAGGCARVDCAARGTLFEIDTSGNFDVLGRSKARSRTKVSGASSAVVAKLGVAPTTAHSLKSRLGGGRSIAWQRTTAECAALKDQQCFGECGSGCPFTGAESVRLPACYAHDFCVCLNDDDHTACMFSVPPGCVTDNGDPCASLAEAVAQFLEVFFSTLVDNTSSIAILLIDFFGDVVGTMFDVVVFTLDVVCDMIGDFLDWLFNDDCDAASEDEC